MVRRVATPFVIYRKHGQVLTETPFFSSIIEGIENEARAGGCQISLHYLSSQSEDANQELANICRVAERGVLILATEMTAEDCMIVDNLGIPYVLIDNAAEGVIADKVLINNYEGAGLAVKQLFLHGHQTIGYLHSAVWINNFSEREAGYRSAMDRLGLPVRNEWIARLGSIHEHAYTDMLAWLDYTKNLPTAFFADNDIIAMGAMKALRERGFDIPQDISILGFDDMPFCTIVEPNLSTMRVDTHAIASLAVRLLLQRNPFKQKIELSTVFVARDSVRML